MRLNLRSIFIRLDDYQVSFKFTGKLNKLTVELQPLKGTPTEIFEFKVQARDLTALGSKEETDSVSEELR